MKRSRGHRLVSAELGVKRSPLSPVCCSTAQGSPCNDKPSSSPEELAGRAAHSGRQTSHSSDKPAAAPRARTGGGSAGSLGVGTSHFWAGRHPQAKPKAPERPRGRLSSPGDLARPFPCSCASARYPPLSLTATAALCLGSCSQDLIVSSVPMEIHLPSSLPQTLPEGGQVLAMPSSRKGGYLPKAI